MVYIQPFVPNSRITQHHPPLEDFLFISRTNHGKKPSTTTSTFEPSSSLITKAAAILKQVDRWNYAFYGTHDLLKCSLNVPLAKHSVVEQSRTDIYSQSSLPALRTVPHLDDLRWPSESSTPEKHSVCAPKNIFKLTD